MAQVRRRAAPARPAAPSRPRRPAAPIAQALAASRCVPDDVPDRAAPAPAACPHRRARHRSHAPAPPWPRPSPPASGDPRPGRDRTTWERLVHHPGRRAPRPPALDRRPTSAWTSWSGSPGSCSTTSPDRRTQHAAAPIRTAAIDHHHAQDHHDPRPPGRPAPRRPPRPPPHPRQGPQRALPARRRRRAHRGAGPARRRPPVNLAFVLDRSGSMGGHNKLGLAKQADAGGDPPPRGPRTASPS